MSFDVDDIVPYIQGFDYLAVGYQDCGQSIEICSIRSFGLQVAVLSMLTMVHIIRVVPLSHPYEKAYYISRYLTDLVGFQPWAAE